MSEQANNPIIHTFYVEPPYHGPPQIFTTERETLGRVNPDGSFLARCFGYNAEEDERTGWVPTTVVWNIVVRDAANVEANS
jgi:hypothetical protein